MVLPPFPAIPLPRCLELIGMPTLGNMTNSKVMQNTSVGVLLINNHIIPVSGLSGLWGVSFSIGMMSVSI